MKHTFKNPCRSYMLVTPVSSIRALRDRAKTRAETLGAREKALLSLSQTLFALAIAVALITIFATYLGYGPGMLGIYVSAVALLLSLSRLAHAKVSAKSPAVSFPEYLAIMFMSGILDRGAPVGLYGSLLFLGGLLIAVSPLVYTYLCAHPHLTESPALHAAGLLLLGATLSAVAVVWYVRRICSE